MDQRRGGRGGGREGKERRRGAAVLKTVDVPGLRGSTGGGVALPHPVDSPHRGTPPGQGGMEILALDDVDVDVCSSSPSRTCTVPRFSSSTECRTSQLCHTQKGDSTVQSLNKVVDVGCA